MPTVQTVRGEVDARDLGVSCLTSTSWWDFPSAPTARAPTGGTSTRWR